MVPMVAVLVATRCSTSSAPVAPRYIPCKVLVAGVVCLLVSVVGFIGLLVVGSQKTPDVSFTASSMVADNVHSIKGGTVADVNVAGSTHRVFVDMNTHNGDLVTVWTSPSSEEVSSTQPSNSSPWEALAAVVTVLPLVGVFGLMLDTAMRF